MKFCGYNQLMITRIDYVDKIFAFKDTPLIKILTGIRRCGKSTVMKMLIERLLKNGVPERQIISHRFDSLEYENISYTELFRLLKNQLIPNKKTYIFLDEIQEIDNWEKVVNSLASDYSVDIYVTGSNSKMLSSEISTYLSGRYISFRIFPLSFLEYKSFRQAINAKENSFSNYVKLGGFPAIHLREFSEDEAYSLVHDIYNSVIFTDVIRRGGIKKTDMFERIVKYIFQNVGNTFSALSISKYLKSENRSIDNETVYEYLKKLESAFIINRCARYDIRGKQILKTQEKFYLADPSLLYSLLGYSSDSISAVLENIVYLELLRRGYNVYVGKYDDFEIDFVAIRREEKLYIQVADRIESEETENREYSRLLSIHDNYRKIVLLNSSFAGGNYEGIESINLEQWLLGEK